MDKKGKNKKGGSFKKKDFFVFPKDINGLWRSVPVPVCQTDRGLNFLEINSAFQKTFGYKKEELAGLSLAKIFAQKKDFQKIKKEVDLAKAVEKEEVFLINRGGLKFLGAVYVKPLPLAPKKTGYFFSFLDISDKKKIKDELQKKIEDLQRLTKELKNSRSALLNILEDIEEARNLAETERDKTLAIVKNFPEGLLFFDRDNRLISANPKIEKLFSLPADTLVGKRYNGLKSVASFKPAIDVLGKDVKPLFKKELKMSENLVLEISSIPILRENKKIGTLVILRDITREKVVERLKTEFVSIAAHQLRTPLSAIKWTLRMMLDGDMGKISSEQKEFLGKTYKSNERMIYLINDLLNVTRIEEGRFLYETKKGDIIKISKSVLGPLKEIARRKKLKIVFDYPKRDLPKVEVDTEKISLAIQNLVDNAINYTKPGGEVRVGLDYFKNKKEIMFSVQDNGIGISDNQKKRIFSKFFRGANAVRAETEGTGLGLYIAKNIIEAHQGKIWFKSKENQGTTFFFTLPVGDILR